MNVPLSQNRGGLRRFTFIGLISLVATVASYSTARSASAASTVQGCPSGYLCLYKGAKWNNFNQRPDAKYFSCGRYVNLSGWVTVGSYINNQTGGVTSKFYSGYNATGTTLRDVPSFRTTGWYSNYYNFYPVNSIKVC